MIYTRGKDSYEGFLQIPRKTPNNALERTATAVMRRAFCLFSFARDWPRGFVCLAGARRLPAYAVAQLGVVRRCSHHANKTMKTPTLLLALATFPLMGCGPTKSEVSPLSHEARAAVDNAIAEQWVDDPDEKRPQGKSTICEGGANGHFLIQATDLTFVSIKMETITEADKLNNVSWRGVFYYSSRALRYSETFSKAETWGSGVTWEYRAEKNNGVWTISTNALEGRNGYNMYMVKLKKPNN